MKRVRGVFGIVFAVLREIFDEAAYARFLERERAAPSREAYARFLQEQAATRVARPRCC